MNGGSCMKVKLSILGLATLLVASSAGAVDLRPGGAQASAAKPAHWECWCWCDADPGEGNDSVHELDGKCAGDEVGSGCIGAEGETGILRFCLSVSVRDKKQFMPS